MKKNTSLIVIFIALAIAIISTLIFSLINNSYKNNNSSDTAKKTSASSRGIKGNNTSQDIKGSIILGGDIMLARWVETRAKKDGWSNLFSDIANIFTSADCVVANLESPMISGKPTTNINSMVFAAKPDAVDALKNPQLSAVSLANNHITDQGLNGYHQTADVLKQNNVRFGGAGTSTAEAQKPVLLKCGNILVSILFGTYGVNLPADGLYSNKLDDLLPTLKKIDANRFTIIFAHWGTEYNNNYSPYQTEMAHSFIDAGADLVVGSHPHVLQPIEIYKNKVIAYSLGNLVFDQAPSGAKTEGALLKISVDNDNRHYEVFPIKIENYYKPVLANDTDEIKERLGIKDFKWST